jgi:hypothetical protein
MATYQFRKGARISSVKADVAAQELSKIHDKHGALSPAVVVDEARPVESPLHPAFEWNDNKAAELYRRTQAQDLIYSVEIVPDEDSIPEKIYTYIPSADSYIPTQVVVSNVDLYAEAREEFAKRFNEALYSLRRFEEIAKKNGNTENAKLLGKAANAMTQLQRALGPALSK